MKFMLIFKDAILNLQRVVNDLDHTAYIAIISALSILLMAIFIFIVKHAFNVNLIKRNMATPIVFSILIFGIIIGLLLLRV